MAFTQEESLADKLVPKGVSRASILIAVGSVRAVKTDGNLAKL
jgi:hypothetical protein